MAELIGRESREIGRLGGTVLKRDLAGNRSVRRQEAHDRERRERFSGPRLADEAKNFPGSNGEGEIADGSRRRRELIPCGRVRRGEGYGQVPDIEERGHDGYGNSGQWQGGFTALPQVHSFAPSGLGNIATPPPGACAPGYILSPLRGLATSAYTTRVPHASGWILPRSEERR